MTSIPTQRTPAEFLAQVFRAMEPPAPVVDLKAQRLARLSNETRELLDLGWWWITESNPPCPSWCTVPHDGGEFRRTGSLVCSRVVAELPLGGQVQAVRVQSADESVPRQIFADTSVCLVGVEDLEPDSIEAACAALRAAAEVCGVSGQ